jgi:hypothetical protein
MLENIAGVSASSLLTLLMVAGCGDTDSRNGSTDSERALTATTAESFGSICETTVLTENDAGCDDPGEDLLASSTETYFLALTQEYLGTQVLFLLSCVDVADCQDKAARMLAQEGASFQYGATLTEEISQDELGGFTSTSGPGGPGMCDRHATKYLLIRTDDAVRVERVDVALAERPRTDDGFCVARPAVDQQEADGAPCASSGVIEGRRVTDL